MIHSSLSIQARTPPSFAPPGAGRLQELRRVDEAGYFAYVVVNHVTRCLRDSVTNAFRCCTVLVGGIKILRGSDL